MTTSTPGHHQLREWLTRSHKMQKELALALGITQAYLSQVLGGFRRPKLEILMAIERLTGVPVESWADISESDSDEPQPTTANSSALPRVKR